MEEKRSLRSLQVAILGALFSAMLLFPSPSSAVVYVHDSPLSLGWAAADGSVDHYNVYFSVDGLALRQVLETASASCAVPVEDGRRYVVRVDAENSAGKSAMSDPSEEIAVFLDGTASDTDGDGMPDSWENTYGLNPYSPSDAGADIDKDGLLNRDEYASGTLPGDSDTDDDGVSDGKEVEAGQNPVNAADNRPVANAGEDRELDPTRVFLDGSGSYDPNGDPLKYTWTQIEGPAVNLINPGTSKPSFLGKKAELHRFQLVVNDGRVNSMGDVVAVDVRNVAPTADAGRDQVVDAGTEVYLNGKGSSDTNEDALSYSWVQREGPPVVLQERTAQECWFVPVTCGVCRFALVVSDGRLASVADEVLVIVNIDNRVPTANAGKDRTEQVNTTVTLDGSGSSDPDGSPLTYQWSQEGGPAPVFLTGAASVQPNFVPDMVGVYDFRLVVNDGAVSSAPDYLTVTVEGENHAPAAVVSEAGGVELGDWVELNGEESYDPDNNPLTYVWLQTKGPRMSLEGADAATTGFYAISTGTFRFQLVVDDGELYSPAAEVVVTVGSPADEKGGLPADRSSEDHSSSGCSSMGADEDRMPTSSDLLFVLCLFLPALGTTRYLRRRIRSR